MSRPLSYIVRGNPENPTLVFLHGTFGSSEDWLPIAEPLSDSFHCVMVDLPGHGASTDRDFDSEFTFESIARELRDFVICLDQGPVTFIGYSFGGRAAFCTALFYPEIVRALIVESGSPGIRKPVERMKRIMVDQAHATRIRDEGLRTFFNYWYQLPVFKSLQEDKTAFDNLIDHRESRCEPEWVAKFLEELSPGRQPSLWGRLDEIKVPALFISGELDPKFEEIMETAAVSVPDARHHSIEKAGHDVHLARPEEYVEVLREFLGSNLSTEKEKE